MIIGVPKEIKPGETRVALTPTLCARLTKAGNLVLIERGAGQRAGFVDVEYQAAGAHLTEAASQVWSEAELVVKVKEPLPAEFGHLQTGQTLFTYLHLAAAPALLQVLLQKRVLGLAYEAVEAPDGSLPLLRPMSQIAGRLAPQLGGQFLQSPQGGAGILLGGVPGVAPAQVTVIGAGNAGTQAVRLAVGLGAHVTVLDLDARKLDAIDTEYHGHVATQMASTATIGQAVAAADLVIGAVLVPGARAPIVVTRAMVEQMRPGRVIVDIAIDQGGCVETSQVTSHAVPVTTVHAVLHYAVPNMPALVGRTATLALTQATEPLIWNMATRGIAQALEELPGLAKGICTREGHITHPMLAHTKAQGT